MNLKPLAKFAEENPTIFPNKQAAYEARRRGHLNGFTVMIGKKIFVDIDRFKEWCQSGGSPLQRAA